MRGTKTIWRLIFDFAMYVWLLLRPSRVLAAENLLLRRQLALYKERGVKPRRADPTTRLALILLSKLFDWRESLAIVQPRTFTRWHRRGFRLLWWWKSRPGRPRIPLELRELIREMALANVAWGEERIANELLLKLGIRVSPRTVRKYMPRRPPGSPRGDQRWSIFLLNHAKAIVACDFFVVVTATFRLLYVFVIIEHGSRRLLHCHVISQPTSQWTRQQLREAIPSDHCYRYLIHDRDSIFSKEFDQSIVNLGLRVLKTPYRSSMANSICERMIGTTRRECLDFMIPLNEAHLRTLLQEWKDYYNGSRAHSSLGPGVPDPPSEVPAPLQSDRHRISRRFRVIAKPVLSGLHHDYALAPA